MIIMDLSQVMISTLFSQIKGHSISVDENLLRHMILNTIRANYKKFKNKYGELIIACDSSNNWRKEVFPYYKANRKKGREESLLDWDDIFKSLNKIRDELKAFFPYRVIHVDSAEADDIIGTLCNEFGRELGGEKILILSGDKDFKQLQRFSNVEQFNPTLKKWLKTPNPEAFLYEHIIRGDKGDGIPNFLSDDDSLVVGTRQKQIRTEKLDKWIIQLIKKDKSVEDIFQDDRMYRNWSRNRQIIDLDCIPVDIEENIIKEYENESGKGRQYLFNYFIKHKLKNLTESMGDF